MVRLPHWMAPISWSVLIIVSMNIACAAEPPPDILPTYTPYSTYTPAPTQIIEVTPTLGPWLCLKGKFQISDEMGGQWLVGEKLICAPEWKISNLYGPNLHDWEGPIHFSDFIPEKLTK